MPVFPAHRKGSVPLSKPRSTVGAARYASPHNGPRSSLSSQIQSKRKTHAAAGKDPYKKRLPLIMDRKQAVYNINNSLKNSTNSINNNNVPASGQRSASDLEERLMETCSSIKKKENSQLSVYTDNNRKVSMDPTEATSVDVYEPVKLKGEVKDHKEPRHLDKNNDGRLYEVVQAKLVDNKMSLSKDYSKIANKRLSLPIVKSKTDSNISQRKDSSQYLSNLFTNPSQSAGLEEPFCGSEPSDLDNRCNYFYNKENIAKNINNSPSSYPSDRPTQEVIERIKKNVERKEEFLKRPIEPLWKSAAEDSTPVIHSDYHVSPQRIQRLHWPPPPTQPPPSPGALSKALCLIMGSRGDNQVMRRMKSEIGGSRTVSFPSTDPSTEQFNEGTPLSHETRSNSLPNSTLITPYDTENLHSYPLLSGSFSTSSNPLTGNIVAKPYGSHLNEDGTPVTRATKPFVSTLTRIHENIPSLSKDALSADPGVTSSTAVTEAPIVTSAESEAHLSSQTMVSPSRRNVPLAWVSDNERIKQLQIVSTRTKRFESPNPEKEAHKTALHRFELSRLSQRANAFNVANRKKEFERRGSDFQGVPLEPGTSFDCSSRLKKFEDANWKGSKGVVKSLSDGGSFFAVSREYCSLPEVSSSTNFPSTDTPTVQNSGNRMIPVGGTKIHCEPPDAKDIKEGRPQNDSDVLERDRTNSTCSYDGLWASTETGDQPRKRPPLVRQHSFHSTLQSHLARAVSSIQQRIAASTEAGVPSSGSSAACLQGAPPPVGAGREVSRRNKHLHGADHDRLVRRVSYLKATSGDKTYSDSDSEEEKHKSGVSPVSLARRAIGSALPSSEDLPSPASFLSSVTSSGLLHVKLAKLHGKRAGDRSWKHVWAVIRGRALLLYKDKHHATQTPLSPEDQVSLRGADAVVASDYTKRRHVFRLSTPAGSQFLLQADSEPSMTAWLNSITVAASQDVESHPKDMTPAPDNDTLSPYLDTAPFSMATVPPSSLVSGSLCPPEASEGNVSPQLLHKNVKKVTSPLRTKSPSGVTPNVKNRKTTGELGSPPKSKTWKGRLGRQLKKMQGSAPLPPSSTPLPEGASIGVCLEDCPPSEENEFVPLLVSLCVGVVESKGLHVQGIYRIPGNRAAVTHLIETVNRGPNAVDLSDTRWSDVNVISSLLKQFFQRLPDPLIPSDLYPHFIGASKLEDPQMRLIEIKSLLQELPDHHYETLRFLCFHLHNVSTSSAHNKMDVRNLAIIFGPTLVRAADDNIAKMVTDMSLQYRIVEMLISQVSWFFNEEESDDPPPIVASSGSQDVVSAESAANPSEMEASSQSLLLGNVQKLEASQKDPKKLLVSSIISAANRRVQKVRKKVEEESVHARHETPPLHGGGYEALLSHSQELPDPLPMSHRRISGAGVSATPAIRSGKHRDARLFGDVCVPLLSKDDRLDSLDSLTTTGSPMTLGGTTTTSTPATGGGLHVAPLSKSEPSHLGEDLAFRSYAGLSASTQERIRRFEMETRAMLQRDVTRHRREFLDKQKIEEELQRAKKDLETEDIFDRLADNPSLMHMMNDYCWAPNRETVSLPSLRPSVSSDPLKSRLAKSSLVPSADTTNASAKDDKLSTPESAPQRQIHEGSDLLNAINATFEKMKTLQDSSLLHAKAELPDGRSPSTGTGSSNSTTPLHRPDRSTSSSNKYSPNGCGSGGGEGTKCKLYRDPSLHRRRTFNAAIKQSASSDSVLYQDFVNQDPDAESPLVEYALMDDQDESGAKEKSEKRTRELLRTETQEGLREKRPKELKRSNTQEAFRGPCLSPSGVAYTRKERRDPSKSSSEVKSRKHNVRELKEKFEPSSPAVLSSAVSSPPLPPSNKSPATSSNEKPSRSSLKQARKARIKRRHTVGGMKDIARVAWLKVIEAAHYADPLKQGGQLAHSPQQDCQMAHSPQLPSWEQLQLFLEAFAEGRKMDVDTQALSSWVAKEKLGNSTPDLDSILSLVLPPQKKEALKRRLSVRECPVKPLHPVLESNV